MHIKQMYATLDLIKDQVWTVGVEGSDLKTILEKLARLSCEVAVLAALEDARRWLCESSEDLKGTKKRDSDHQIRVNKMVNEVYVDCPTSYTPFSIKKLALDEFNCLIEVAPKYILKNLLPFDWIHCERFQLAVAMSEKSGSDFKKKYQEQEYIQTPKRVRTEGGYERARAEQEKRM